MPPQSLAEIHDVIDEVAFETSLLALDAALVAVDRRSPRAECRCAGESGAGTPASSRS
jgi:hypothetical protein